MSGARNTHKQIDKMLGLTEDDNTDISEADVNLTPEGEGDDAQDTQSTVAGEGATGKDTQQSADGQRDAGAGEQRGAQRGKEQPQGQGGKPGQLDKRRLPANGQGDLLDPTTGAVIARAGNERRLFEHARNVSGQLAQTQQEIATLRGQVQAFQQLQSAPQAMGLDVQEQHVAMQFMSHWKKNPVEAATKMLAELRAMGYEVEGLASPVDMAALKKMVEDTIAPFRSDRDAQELERTVSNTVDQELAQAQQWFPWLETQQDAVARVLAADESLSLREAALMVQSWAAQHGLDLHSPLQAQIAAQQSGQTQQYDAPPPRANAARNPPPTGNEALAPRRNGAVAQDRRNRDIVLESMREAGLNVDSLL